MIWEEHSDAAIDHWSQMGVKGHQEGVALHAQVRDAVTRDCHRADHLLEAALELALKDAAKNDLPPEKVQVRRRFIKLVRVENQSAL